MSQPMSDPARPTPVVRAGQPEIVLSEERLVPGVQRVPYRRLRVAKRVLVEQQSVTVEVRREELVIEELAIDGAPDAAVDAVPDGAPLVLVLSREVPAEVVMRTEPVEVVRVHVDRVTEQQSVTGVVRRERGEFSETVEEDPPLDRPTGSGGSTGR